ncbi:G protein-coupled glucose receptor regulating Gpa2-domain-containing protein [Podospora fimiseda]|uniref:G protein-coupled glucose receptor regulating Gpa2-domain-containing protein n=1 Tax=Podospora fimiseda TaxID=252190 RepID=A0AAN7BQC4_9PEZI|nr:G protein-coupled glucose receptor regulating Gpa2-domain-containing protein [Podospora fimiseda]
MLGLLPLGSISLRMLQARYVPDSEHSQHIVYVLSILSLVFASLSVVSTISTLYWFVKMRRSFRHELILLLVQSDLVKSAAFVVFPIVSMLLGPNGIKSDSAFCQVSGFVLAVGIESSDVAILLIALHSVMYIFRPQSGLYPFRHYAYMVFYLFPVTTACLAFIDGPGYENVGHYCYLRTDNHWSRLALSWIPRYVIFFSIASIYIFIYLYIRKRMDDYGRRSSGSLEATATSTPEPITRAEPRRPSLRIPRISYHGLIPSTPSSHRTSVADTVVQSKSRQASASSVSTVRVENSGGIKNILESPIITITAPSSLPRRASISQQHKRRSIRWSWEGFDQPSVSSRSQNILVEETQDPFSTEVPSPSPPSNLLPISLPPPTAVRAASRRRGLAAEAAISASADDLFSFSEPASPNLFYTPPVRSNWSTTQPNRSSIDATNWSEYLNQQRKKRSFSLPDIFTILRRGHSQSEGQEDETLSSSGRNASLPVRFNPSMFEETTGSVSRHRDKIRRQLRSLFVYPLVYMFVWTFPFISHVMGYDDSVLSNDPQWLLVLGILSLSVQAMVDCFVFTIREQPWRHAKGRGFWESLRKRWWWFGGKGGGQSRRGVTTGRTREEMLVDGRLARQRRAEEIVDERRERIIRVGDGGGNISRHSGRDHRSERRDFAGRGNGQGTREWWDYGAYAFDLEDDDEEEEEGRERSKNDQEEGGGGGTRAGGLWMSGGGSSSSRGIEQLESQRVPV